MNIELADLLKKAIDVELTAKIHTMLPGRIIDYDVKNQKASVQPLIKRSYENGEVQSMPIIVNVPVVFPRSGGGSLTFPVEPEDTALLFFSERALERWLSLGGEVDAGASRKFSIKDCVAIMGIIPFNQQSFGTNTDSVWKYKNAQIALNNNDKLAIGNNNDELFAICVDLIDVLKDITVDGNPIDPLSITELNTIKSRFISLKGALT